MPVRDVVRVPRRHRSAHDRPTSDPWRPSKKRAMPRTATCSWSPSTRRPTRTRPSKTSIEVGCDRARSLRVDRCQGARASRPWSSASRGHAHPATWSPTEPLLSAPASTPIDRGRVRRPPELTRPSGSRVVSLAQRVDRSPRRLSRRSGSQFIVGHPDSPGMLADLLASNADAARRRTTGRTPGAIPSPRSASAAPSSRAPRARGSRSPRPSARCRDEAESTEHGQEARRERMLRSATCARSRTEIGEGDAGMREVDELREKLEAAGPAGGSPTPRPSTS